METNKEERKEILEKIIPLYDNMYEGSSPIDYYDEENIMDDMYLSNLRSNIPHIIFADTSVIRDINGNLTNKMFFHAMTLDTLKYYLKDPNAIFTNWVINDDSSEFTQIYHTRLTDTSFKPEKVKKSVGINHGSDILGGPYLHMANLNVGKGGTHGNRRFFQLQLSSGKKLIDAESALQLYTIDKSKIFILRPRMQPTDNNIIDITRSGGLYSDPSTISGTHGQAPETIIYELIPYNSLSYEAIFNRNGDEIFDTVSGQGNRGREDINKLEDYILQKYEFERKDDGDEHQSYMEEVRLKDIASWESIPTEELLKMTVQERGDIEKETKILKHNIDQLLEGKFEDREENENPFEYRYDDFGYIFSENNTDGILPIDFQYNQGKNTEINALISLDHIPKSFSIFWENQYTHKYVIFILENAEGIEQTVCGKIISVFSNLNGYAEIEDGTYDNFHPNKGQWIYHINFKIGEDSSISILIGEKRVTQKSDGSLRVIEQISLDKPKVLKNSHKILENSDLNNLMDTPDEDHDFRMQLVTRAQAIEACKNVSGLSNDNIKPEDFLNFEVFDTEDFDMLLPVGRIIGDMDTGDSPLSLEQSMSLTNSMENSFLEDQDEDIMDVVRNFAPHPPQNISQETIEESPTNSPLRVPRSAQLSRQLERGLPNPFPGLFPEVSSSNAPFLSPSAQALASLRDDSDSEEEASIHSPPYSPVSPPYSPPGSSTGVSDVSDDNDNGDIGEIVNLNQPSRRRLRIVNDNGDLLPQPPARRRLNELNRAQNTLSSLRRGTVRERSDSFENDPNPSRLQSPRRGIDSIGLNPDGSYIEPIAPASPLVTRNSNSPSVVPETPPERMGDPSFYREQDEKRRKEEAEESEED